MNQQDLINALRTMGRKKLESPTLRIIDKADWHFESVAQAGLDNIKAYIPGGFLLGWLIDRNLVSKDFLDTAKVFLPKYKDRELSAASLYKAVDGVLSSEMLNERGTKFLAWYEPMYLTDYQVTLLAETEEEHQYNVNDSWDNFSKLSNLLDERLDEFKKTGT